MSNPLISVIMPVYNAEKFLEESISSILNQTFNDFEFLIFNDGSQDSSYEIMNSYTNSRIRIFNSESRGYLIHLNHGLQLSKGKYIARMDADDISHPKRFELQFDFLEKNSSYGLCGSFIQFISEFDDLISWVTAEDHDEITVTFLYQNTICHSSVMIRKSIITGHNLKFRENYYLAEDYKFWIELSKYARLYNMPEPLLKYRIHEAQVSNSKNLLQRKIRNQILSDQLIDLNINPSDEMILMMDMLSDYNQKFINASALLKLVRFIKIIKKQNLKYRIYDTDILKNILNRQLAKQPKSMLCGLINLIN